MIFQSIRWRIQFWHGVFLLVFTGGMLAALYHTEYRLQIEKVDATLQDAIQVTLPLVSLPGEMERFQKPGAKFPPRSPPPGAETGHTDGKPGLGKISLEGNRIRFGNPALFLVGWDRSHALVVQTPNPPAFALEPLEPAHHTGSRAETREGYRMRIVTLPRSPEARLQVGYDLAKIRESMRAYGMVLAAAGLAAWLLIMSVGWFFVGQSLQAIDRIRLAAEKIARGELGERIEIGKTESELGSMALFLNATFDRLERAYRQQIQFTADASHEMRTPISIILSRAQLALRAERSGVEYRRTLESCVQAARHMTGLIESLQKLSQMDSGAFVLNREPADLAAVAEETVSLVEALAAENGIGVERLLLPCRGDYDVRQIRQLVLNLLSNSLKYCRPGDRVRIETREEGHRHILVVADNGPGIAPGHLPYVFDRFYRVDPSRSGETGNTGLGLAICKAIVDAHGGSILAESGESNLGCRFIIRFENDGS